MFRSCSPLDCRTIYRINPTFHRWRAVSNWRDPECTKGPSWAMGLKVIRCDERLFLVLERVADRDAEACCPRSAEFKIVIDQIKTGFRTDKDARRSVKAHSSAK